MLNMYEKRCRVAKCRDGISIEPLLPRLLSSNFNAS
jgi:hypothetical protein